MVLTSTLNVHMYILVANLNLRTRKALGFSSLLLESEGISGSPSSVDMLLLECFTR